MKKYLIACALFLSLAMPVSAEIDLSGMSYAELVALKDQINLAMWDCEQWQEVTVPQGIWEVGVDIPAGHWTVTAADGAWASVMYGSKLNENGKSLARSDDYFSEIIVSPSSRIYAEGQDNPQIDIDAKTGAYICVDDGSVVFTPYSGKPSLGFK